MLLNILAECEKYQVLHLVTKFNLMSALCPGLRLHDNEYVSQVLKSLNRIYNILDTEGTKMTEQKNLSGTPNFFHYKKLTPNFWPDKFFCSVILLHVYNCMLFCAKYSNFHSDKGEILNGELIKSYMFQMLCVSDTIDIHTITLFLFF